jgi:hypothetical protein
MPVSVIILSAVLRRDSARGLVQDLTLDALYNDT